MKNFKQTSDLLSRDIIESEVPIRHIHNGVVINRDGSIAIAIRVQFPYLTTYNEDQKGGLFHGLRGLFDSLPAAYNMQVIFGQHSSPNQISEMKEDFASKENVIDDAQYTHLQNLEERLKEGEVRYFEGVIALIREPVIRVDLARSRMWQKYKKSQDYKDKKWLGRFWKRLSLYVFSDDVAFKFTKMEWEEVIKEICQQGDSYVRSLSDLNLRPVFMEDEALISFFYRFWNPRSFNHGGGPIPLSQIPHPASDYFLKGDLDLAPEEVPKGVGIFRMDDCYHQILTVRMPGEILTFCQWEGLLYYDGISNIRVIVNSSKGNRAKKIEKLKIVRDQMQRRVAKDAELTPALVEIEEELVELGENNSNVWDVTTIIHLWHESTDELISNSKRLTQRAESMNGMQVTVEVEAALEYWRSAQPCWTRDLDRYRDISMDTNRLVTQLPVCGEHHGMDRKRLGAVLETATGSLHNYYPHDDLIYSNYNAVVIGGTRSGKTFFVLTLLILLKKLMPRVTIVDVGGSFRGLCDVVGGNYVEIDLDSGLHTINPLHLGDNKEYTNEDIARIRQVIEQMLVDRSSDKVLKSEEIVVVEDALYQLLEKQHGKGEAYLSDLKDVLSNHGAIGARMAQRLKRYCGNTGKGKLFDGPTKLDTENRFTVYDLTKAAEDKEITPLMFQILINNVIRSGMENMGDLKFLIFDECWKFLSENGRVADFVEYAFRGLAKFNFATIAITQGIEELSQIKNSSAILNNTSQRFIFKQETPEAARQAKEVLGLNEQEERMIQDLQSEVGHFSQCLHLERLRTGESRSTVVTNRASPLTHAICTTQGRDQAQRKKYISEGMTLREAILQFAKEFPRGVSQAEQDTK